MTAFVSDQDPPARAHPAGHTTPPSTQAVRRLEVWCQRHQDDTQAHTALRETQHAGLPVAAIRSAAVFLIAAPLDATQIRSVAEELLADPITQHAVLGHAEAQTNAVTIEVHPQSGVMDPVAESTRAAILDLFPSLSADQLMVRTGQRFDFTPVEGATLSPESLLTFASTHLGNPVIEDFSTAPYAPATFPKGQPYNLNITNIPLRGLDDQQLTKLSREAHLFLSLDEMKTVQSHFNNLPDGGREPTDIELETLAQTWSEHCVHKTLKSTVRLTGDADALAIFQGKPGCETHDDGSITIHNLLKSTVAAATFALRDLPADQGGKGDWLVSVFDDNAGIVKLDDAHGIAIKVETHNHPSAIEPYGGAATGIGGCIRDIIGTGLSAKPIANTDTFAVAPPTTPNEALPAGVIHPRRVLEQVVAGVRDYGNRMGIPTVNGTVLFHDDYVANPLVFAGCVGILPLDQCFGDVKPGDRIVALGGRTGRDGIHGATFSSAELTDTHADEFGHAVQIGNAITEKRVLDVILQARDHEAGCLFSAITDCGAGGFSSAIGEMGEKVGADVHLDAAPLKYDGLSYPEIWISEAQERMVLSVPQAKLATLQALCDAEDVELADLGTFGCHDQHKQPQLRLHFRGQVVGELPMSLMHDGIPMPTRDATWHATATSATPSLEGIDLADTLCRLLGHPNIASKHWVVRQYDHEVQGGSVVKPLVGPLQLGPSDAAVIRPKLDTELGVALSNGVCPWLSEKVPGGDSYQATLHAIDEAVRNAVCVGADPRRIAILDNFCWPSCDDPESMGTLARAAQACYDGAMAFGTPFVSGKDSLHNQFTTEDGRLIAIPPTLLVTALGIVDNVNRCVTMDAKQPGNTLLLVGETKPHLGGSHVTSILEAAGGPIPTLDLQAAVRNAHAVASIIAAGQARSAHDCSEGGLLVAAAEMAFSGDVGLELALPPTTLSTPTQLFAETASRYLLEIHPDHMDAALKTLRAAGVPFAQVGSFANHARLTVRDPQAGQVLDLPLQQLRDAWRNPLDW
ncbi:MAG: phosphoribosylformylglycinamidine synthase subunit PurL [Planctomycetota bacterium]